MFLDIIHRPVVVSKHRPVYVTQHNVSTKQYVVLCNINRTVFLDKDRTMDNVQKYNI
jgi:hypothetical protein